MVCSCGFVGMTIESEIWTKLLAKSGLVEEEILSTMSYNCDGAGCDTLINTDPAETVLRIVFSYGMPDLGGYEDIWNDVYNCKDTDAIKKLAEKTLEEIKQYQPNEWNSKENISEYGKRLELIIGLCGRSKEFNSEADVFIESGTACNEENPHFNYAHLKMKQGKGVYVEYCVDESQSDNVETDSEFKQWAMENGYYDPTPGKPFTRNGYDVNFFTYPPFEEYAETGPGVTRVIIGEEDAKNASTEEPESGSRCEGLTFVIAGRLNRYDSLEALVAYIEAQGGKVANVISSEVDYLINNNFMVNSGVNRKAADCGVKVITEKRFLARFGEPAEVTPQIRDMMDYMISEEIDECIFRDMLPEEIEEFYQEVKEKLPIAKKKAKMMANGYPIDFLLGDFGDEFVE